MGEPETSTTPETDPAALALLSLVLEQQQTPWRAAPGNNSWVNRLVERIELLDESLIRRRISIDLTVPAETGWAR